MSGWWSIIRNVMRELPQLWGKGTCETCFYFFFLACLLLHLSACNMAVWSDLWQPFLDHEDEDFLRMKGTWVPEDSWGRATILTLNCLPLTFINWGTTFCCYFVAQLLIDKVNPIWNTLFLFDILLEVQEMQ